MFNPMKAQYISLLFSFLLLWSIFYINLSLLLFFVILPIPLLLLHNNCTYFHLSDAVFMGEWYSGILERKSRAQ